MSRAAKASVMEWPQVNPVAIAESRTALLEEPASQPARDSLFEALGRKVALLQDMIALMNQMRKGDEVGAGRIVEELNRP